MRSPLSFQIEKREDLLVWADLFLDWGEEAYAEALRLLHATNRWPRKKGDGVMWSPVTTHCRWLKDADTLAAHKRDVLRYRFRLAREDWGVDSSRSYPSLTLAFLDVASHWAWKAGRGAEGSPSI